MNMNHFLSLLGCAFALSFLLTSAAMADQALKAAPIFGDHMVLQRGIELPVWGIAEPGAAVMVNFGGERGETKAGGDGQWRVVLGATEASAKPGTMTVSSGSEKLKFEDVLVGEVWVCSGQSNMQFKLSSCTDGAAEIAAANHPELRLNTSAGWAAASPESVPGFSGVAYFFGRKLNAETGVPVGLIGRSVGGTPVDWWTPKEKLERVAFGGFGA